MRKIEEGNFMKDILTLGTQATGKLEEKAHEAIVQIQERQKQTKKWADMLHILGEQEIPAEEKKKQLKELDRKSVV